MKWGLENFKKGCFTFEKGVEILNVGLKYL